MTKKYKPADGTGLLIKVEVVKLVLKMFFSNLKLALSNFHNYMIYM